MSKPQDICMFKLTVNGIWQTIIFLPMFDDQFVWCTEVLPSFCNNSCSLACYCHPLVPDPKDRNCYYKLCTLSAAKAGLVDLKYLTSCKGGCGGKDSDYSKAVRLMKNLKFIPRITA